MYHAAKSQNSGKHKAVPRLPIGDLILKEAPVINIVTHGGDSGRFQGT